MKNLKLNRRAGRNFRLRGEVSDITKRRLGIIEIGAIIKRGAVIFLEPTFLHAELFQRG